MALLPLFTNSIFGLTIRSVQIFFALLTWALEAAAVDKFSTNGAFAWLLVAGLISFIYGIVILVFSLLRPRLIVPGAVMITEAFCALINFTGFIAAAATIGDASCSGVIYTGFTTYGYSSNGCRAAKAGVAFGALNWALFSFTAAVFGFFSISKLITEHTSLWSTGPLFSTGVLTLQSSSTQGKSTSSTGIADEEATVGGSPPGEKADELADAPNDTPTDAPVQNDGDITKPVVI